MMIDKKLLCLIMVVVILTAVFSVTVSAENLEAGLLPQLQAMKA